MPYSSSKKNDIFVSYAHDDDIYGWVKHSAKLLKRTLDKQLKILESGKQTDVKVWTDSSLPSSGELRARLETQIKDSALFLVIMSESYLVSEWCKEEGEEFVHNLRDNIYSRIFIAEKEKTDKNNWPAYLKDDSGSPLLSKEFYQEKYVGKYKSIRIRLTSGDFNSEAADLVDDLCDPISDALYNGESLDPLTAEIQGTLTVNQNHTTVEEMESILIEIRSLREDREEATKVGKAIIERAKVWNQRAGGGKIHLRPRVLYDGAKAEDIDELSRKSKGTVIVYVRNPPWVDKVEEELSRVADRIGRIAICDPVPKAADFLVFRQIEMFSSASQAEREQEIDEFIEELVKALASNR